MNNLDLEGEFTIEDNQNNEQDELAGQLQEILISIEFEEISNDFLRENCSIFDDNQNDKAEHRAVFQEYQTRIKAFIEEQLQAKGLQLNWEQLKDLQLDDQMLETLDAISDFELFKDIMLETRVRVEEEERTVKRTVSKATKGYKQAPNNNIFSVQQPPIQFKQKANPAVDTDLRPDLFFSVVSLGTPKVNKKQI